MLSHQNPSPKTELNFSNNFQLLVAVVLSAQTTDIMVNKVTSSLFDFVKEPEQMVEFGEENLINSIKSIGLFRAKAKNVIELSKVLVSEYNSQVPDSFEKLITLPGVGRKTANVVLNCLFGQKTIAVDTHVYRVSKRLGLAKSNTPDKVENELLKLVPEEFKLNAHHWLILHGRYICTARKPRCSTCIINDYCKEAKKIVK